MLKKLVVLISDIGTGTNLQAIIKGIESGKINAKIETVIADVREASGLQIAKRHGIATGICPKKEELLSILERLDPDFICLDGWKRIIPIEVIERFPNRILNVHPGLIPDTVDGAVKNPDGTEALWNKGKMGEKAMENFIDKKVTYAGSSVHFLTKEFDFGPVLGRAFERIQSGDTKESLYARLKTKENGLYVDVLIKLCSFRLAEQGGRMKTVLIVDGGGRGSALVDKYGQSKQVGKILVVPGNDLMQINTKKKVVTYQRLRTTSILEILGICQKEKVDLVDVAQDNAVEAGLVDELNKAKIPAVGPTKLAGQIEWDKAWARDFMKKYKIPSPEYHVFTSEKEGINFVTKNPKTSWFVKASGLAEGKGAIPVKTSKEAIVAIKQMQKFGLSGETYLLEEWLIGEEFSAFAICDGGNFKIAGFAQDHKRVNDGDKGPNTGGMGCVSNPLIVNENIKKQVESIFQKAVEGLKKEGRPYKGVLYLGGIVVNGNVNMIEFNARWGDPEAEVILLSIKNDLYKIGMAIISGSINGVNLKTDTKVRVAVAACSKGYPLDYSKVKGKKVLGIEKIRNISGVKVYGAGIRKEGKNYIASGGRVLFVVGEGQDVIKARQKVYQAMKLLNIEGDDLHYRTDIGWRDVERMQG